MQLRQIESILRLSRLLVRIAQKVPHERDHLGQHRLVRAIFGGVLEHGLEEQWVPRETGSGLSQICIEFQLPRLRHPLRGLDKRRKRGIRTLLLLKLVFSIQMMRAIGHKRTEMEHGVEQNVANLLDDGVQLLSLGERHVQESRSGGVGNDVSVFETVDPGL